MYDFDKIIKREGTSSVKWDFRKEVFGKADVLPMWVADMDFETPGFIVEAVSKRASHPVYGYSLMEQAYYEAFISWVKRRHDWELKKEWIVFSPGIVTAVNAAVKAFTKAGDGVIVQPPVYFPFFNSIKNNKRKQLNNQLIYIDETYKIDFGDLRKKAKEAKLILLSSPHNPVSRCWTKNELISLGKICLENDIIIISDEIHADLILPGHKHIPLASLSEELSRVCVTCMAPSKTFNVAGLFTSMIIIENEGLRKRYIDVMESVHLVHANLFGMVAAQAGYSEGDRWVDEMMAYVNLNFKYVDEFLKTGLPSIRMAKAEATYLAWLDFSKTGLSGDKLNKKLIAEAGIGLSPGSIFGPGGEGFMRMNLGAPKHYVIEALGMMKKVF
ncbi:MAG: putative C-S lyase [Chlorobi bacterium]|nr:putative C-S lyase [Chlorobiota bacterium]